MSAPEKAREIEELIAPSVTAMGYDLVRVAFVGGKTLQILAERHDGSMTADDCAELSRAISALLDVEDPIEESYLLEVSSPGIDRPLVKKSDFERFAGYAAKIETQVAFDGRKRFSGTLRGVDGEDVEIDTADGRFKIPLNLIAKAKLQISDELMKQGRAS